jgi:DNA helicase II / ATP-dependent DNA helicase PcrA
VVEKLMNKNEMARALANCVCSVPFDISIKHCFGEQKKRSGLPCSDYDKCRILEKSEDQLRYVLSPINQNIFLDACPGSGKTEVVGLKAAYEMKNWKKSPEGIAVLTFTNNARDVIADRITQFVGNKGIGFPHYIGTIDSWLYSYIGHPFGYLKTGYVGDCGDKSFKLVSSSRDYGFVKNSKYQTKWGYAKKGNVSANHFYYDAEEVKYIFSSSNRPIDAIRQSEPQEKWRKEDLYSTKGRFWKDGFATYQDIELICFEMLKCSEEFASYIAKRFSMIFIDECQDLSFTQLQIINSLMEQGSIVHLIGDLQQGIFAFRKVEPRKVKKFINDCKFLIYNLQENFRSTQTIVDTCSEIVDQKTTIGIEKNCAPKPCVYFFYPENHEYELPNKFTVYIDKIKEILLQNSAIVARGDSTIQELRPGTSYKNRDVRSLPTAMHLWAVDNIESKREAIGCAGRFVSERYYNNDLRNSREYFCPKSYSSVVKWRIDLSKLLNACRVSTMSDLSEIWSKWSSKVNKEFPCLIKKVGFEGIKNFQIKIRSPQAGKKKQEKDNGIKLKDVPVIQTLHTVEKVVSYGIEITTIHKIKGKTLDAILLVSAQNAGMGGKWSEWLKDKQTENARFAYVASSRPKYLLAWAIPEPKEKDKDMVKSKIEELGFEFVDI